MGLEHSQLTFHLVEVEFLGDTAEEAISVSNMT